MIKFHTNYDNLYNDIIHNFLKKDIFNTNKDLGDIVEKISPKYLRREQFKNCESAILDLYNWSSDSYNHELGNIHQIMLYNFLLTIEKRQKKITNFVDKYFTKATRQSIEVASKNENSKNDFYDVKNYYIHLFKDKDLLSVNKLFETHMLMNYLSKKTEKIISYYDILPLEIQEKFNYEYINLFEYIKDLLAFIENECKEENMQMLFWEDDNPMSESQIQVVLENIIDAYFFNEEIDITRESLVGSGKIDFKFYRNKEEKILFEIKKADNSHLKDGYENQIIKYMKSWHCKNAFYIIICFTDEDYNKANKFMNNHEDTDEYHEYVQIKLFDFRKKKRNCFIKRANFDTEPFKAFDNYFSHIATLKDIQDVESATKYLDELSHNYNSLTDTKLKEEYIRKLHKICSQRLDISQYMERLLNKDKFYVIMDSHDAIKRIMFRLLGNVTNEQKFHSSIQYAKNFFSTKIKPCSTSRITQKEIHKIFQFLKKKHATFYKLLTNFDLDIYILNITDKTSDCDTIASESFKTFTLGCYYMYDSEYYKMNLINPIYMFFLSTRFHSTFYF